MHHTLKEFHLNPDWISLIMNRVSNVNSSIIWNGESLPNISVGRGLRQGDPLSPYLFVLCMENLSNMIRLKTQTRAWKGLRAARHSISISHLFFADDLILFAKANTRNCDCIMEVLNEFCEISGQKINLQKSKLFVSSNSPRSEALSLSYQSGIGLTHDLGKYLGTPVLRSRISKNHVKDIIVKITNGLSGWKANTLSFAGRITLVQSVTTAIPNHLMQTMEIPRSVCDKINSLNRNFI